MAIDYSKQIGKKISTKGNKRKSINIENIMYLQCDGDLTTIYLDNEEKVYEIKTLKEFEEELCDKAFFRINYNTIVNGKYITEMDTKINKRMVCLGKIVLKISKNRLKNFKNWIS